MDALQRPLSNRVAESGSGERAPSTQAFAQRLAEQAVRSPHKIALSRWVPGKGFALLTYRDLLGLSEDIEKSLAVFSHVVPILGGKSFQAVAAMVAASRSRLPFCFLNPKWRRPQLEFALRQLRAKACFLDSAGLLALQGLSDRDLWTRNIEWIVIEPELAGLASEMANRLASFATLRSMPLSSDTRGEAACPDSPLGTSVGACLFTSGSTGRPKGVLVSAEDLDARIDAEIAWFGLTEADVLLNVLPFSFDVGLAQLMTGLALGAEVAMLESWLPRDILLAVEQRSVTCIAGVPSVWSEFVRQGVRLDSAGRHRSLRYVTVSGGSLPLNALEQLMKAFEGVGIYKTYGQTEAFRATSLRPEDLHRKLGSVGKPFPGVHVRVVRDDGTLCAPGEVGEVIHCGLGTMVGYLDDDNEVDVQEKRKLRANPFFGHGDEHPQVVFTGDLGFLDEDGFLFLKGRRDALIKVFGNRVYPLEVAEQIASLPGIEDVYVAPVSGTSGEAELAAFILAREPALSRAEVRKALALRLPSYMVPKHFVFVDGLPKGATGKIDGLELISRHGFAPYRAEGPTLTMDSGPLRAENGACE
ncbi:MAG: acyl--CoA ligase [Candidatus Binatia bacterium]|nr:acyl--CoA ligase [Candidatus Binatia bacterium]